MQGSPVSIRSRSRVLLFLCTFLAPGRLSPEGLRSTGEPFALHRTLATAEAACRLPGHRGRVLVLDAARMALATADPPSAHVLPREAIVNLDADGRYRPPVPVPAAGGYVVRKTKKRLDLLLIFRRGAWDLPKGKLDAGEAPAAGARREVSEEVGIPEGQLQLLGPLGTTVHGYPLPKRDRYAVKTTHWFAFTTDADGFTPQAEEGIEAVAWVPWSEAGARLGYESLRAHHAGLDPAELEERLG